MELQLKRNCIIRLYIDWPQSPMTKYVFFFIIPFDNPLKYNQHNIMNIKAGHTMGLIGNSMGLEKKRYDGARKKYQWG